MTIWPQIFTNLATLAETTATRGSNDRRMCFDRRGVIFAVLDEFQSLYFANVIYCSKNGSRSIPYLAGNLVIIYRYTVYRFSIVASLI